MPVCNNNVYECHELQKFPFSLSVFLRKLTYEKNYDVTCLCNLTPHNFLIIYTCFAGSMLF